MTILNTDIRDAEHIDGVEIYQFIDEHHEPDFVILDEDLIAEIVRRRFELQKFTFSDLITAVELWEREQWVKNAKNISPGRACPSGSRWSLAALR